MIYIYIHHVTWPWHNNDVTWRCSNWRKTVIFFIASVEQLWGVPRMGVPQIAGWFMTNPSISGWFGGDLHDLGNPHDWENMLLYPLQKTSSDLPTPNSWGFIRRFFLLTRLWEPRIDLSKPCEACHCAIAPECPAFLRSLRRNQMVISTSQVSWIFMDFQHTPWMSLADCCSKQGVMFWSGWTWDRKNM